LGIGEAFVTALDEKGIPTPLAATLMRPPKSRMGILSEQELKAVLQNSQIAQKYSQDIDRESAEEILEAKIKKAKEEEELALRRADLDKAKSARPASKRTNRKEENSWEKLSKNTMVRQVGRTIGRELVRGLLGILGVKRRR